MRAGPYEILDEIGRGGAGTVYRARSPEGRIVALKVLRRAGVEAKQRFEREERLQAELGQAEGFVGLLDAGESAEGEWLVMPFLAGGTLRDRLRLGPLPVADAVSIATTLAMAAGRAHARGIVHRDLKPENVLFDLQGRPLIADLGLAKHFATGDASERASLALSKTHDSRGTIGYMAPEQLGGARDAQPPADVFALGAILHECVTGEAAFAGGSSTEVLVSIAKAEVRPLRALRRDAPAWLEAVVRRALSRDPARRFEDGAALAEALVAGASPPRPGRGRLFAGAGVALLLVSAGALAVTLRPQPRPELSAIERARLAFDAATDEVGFGAAARALEAARVAPEGRLAPEDERRLVAARSLAGNPDVPRLAALALARDPAVERAVRVLYERALGVPAPIKSLDALSALAPPAELKPRVAKAWLAEAVREGAAAGVVEHVRGAAAVTDMAARERALAKALEFALRCLDPLGRSLALDPEQDPFPPALGPTFTAIRLTARATFALKGEMGKTWKRAIAGVPEHPLGLVVRGRLSEAAGEPAVVRAAYAKRAFPAFERAGRRTAHVRALAHELMRDVGPERPTDPDAEARLELMERYARFVNYKQAWTDVIQSRRKLQLSVEAELRLEAEGELRPDKVWDIFSFDPDDDDPR